MSRSAARSARSSKLFTLLLAMERRKSPSVMVKLFWSSNLVWPYRCMILVKASDSLPSQSLNCFTLFTMMPSWFSTFTMNSCLRSSYALRFSWRLLFASALSCSRSAAFCASVIWERSTAMVTFFSSAGAAACCCWVVTVVVSILLYDYDWYMF